MEIPQYKAQYIFNSIPTGNLTFLSNMKGTFKAEASNKAQITFQIWQQK